MTEKNKTKEQRVSSYTGIVKEHEEKVNAIQSEKI